MLVRDMMRSPIITVSHTATYREAVALLSNNRISSLPVVDEQGILVGIISEHDIIKAVLPSYEDIVAIDASTLSDELMENRVMAVRDLQINHIMTANVLTMSEADTVLKAASTMIMRKKRALPVVRDGKPVGIVSRIDILNAVVQGRTG